MTGMEIFIVGLAGWASLTTLGLLFLKGATQKGNEAERQALESVGKRVPCSVPGCALCRQNNAKGGTQ